MVSLSEELLLIALRDDSGTFPSGSDFRVKFALAGAVAVELLLSERIRLGEKQRVEVVDGTPTGDDVLDEALAKIGQRKRPRSLKDWVSNFGQGGIKDLTKRVLSRLLDRGILREQEGRILWVFPTRHYPTLDSSAEMTVRERLRGVVLHGMAPDERTVALLSLLKASRLLDEVFDKEERRAAGKRVDALTKGDATRQAVADAIAATEAAVSAALTATLAASSYTSSSS